MLYAVKLEERTPQPTACAHETIPEGEMTLVGKLIGEVFGYLERNGLHPSGPPYGRSTWQAGADLEVGFPVAAPIPGDGRVVAGELPGVWHAVTMHTGPYGTIPGAYQAVNAWIEAQGLRPVGLPWEAYLSDPAAEPDPEKWQTVVVAPVV